MIRPIAPRDLRVGAIYLDAEGRQWGVLERDRRGGARLVSPPEDAPSWHGVTLDPDGAWWQGTTRLERDPYLERTGGLLACRGCARAINVSPREAEANHRHDCPWLAARAAAGPEPEPALPPVSLGDWDPAA